MRPLIAALLVLIALSFGASGWALKQRFDQGRDTRVSICQGQNTLRKILHDEHQTKLDNSLAYLKKHPNGAPSIGVTRQDILAGIAQEKSIVAETVPLHCH